MEKKSLDHDLLVQLPASAISLFAVFSRFECALKRSGYHHGNGDAHANWDKFANSLGKDFFEEVSSSGNANLLIGTPPKKQVVDGDDLDWQAVGKVTNVQELFVSVRRVRNNLFHGGKYRSGTFPMGLETSNCLENHCSSWSLLYNERRPLKATLTHILARPFNLTFEFGQGV